MANRIKVLPRLAKRGLLPELPPVYIEMPDEINLRIKEVDVEPAFPFPRVVLRGATHEEQD